MHIPDGFLSGGLNAAGYIVSAGVMGLALAKARRESDDKTVPLMGVTAAFVFAAQMLNFPVAGGTSGHFLGAAMAAILLGPLKGCLIMAMVLFVQCIGFANGGLTSLGTNIFNMGIVAGIGGYFIFRGLNGILPDRKGSFFAAAGISSWFSVVIASGFCAVELAVSGTSPLGLVLPAMVGVHAIIGVGEAIITVAVLSMVYGYRPDLIYRFNKGLGYRV